MVNKYTKYIRNRAPRPELHDKILLATKAMFYKQGIKQVRMDDIAKELTISKRTLYEIFNDKETLLLECIKYKHQQEESYLQALDLSNANVLEVVLRYYEYTMKELPHINPTFFEDMKKYPGVLAYMRSKRDQNFKDVVSYFTRGIEQGIFLPDVDMELFIRLLNLTFDHSMESEIYKSTRWTVSTAPSSSPTCAASPRKRDWQSSMTSSASMMRNKPSRKADPPDFQTE